eukprot:scaffold1484_cov118-Isochrysis_galbana.AAC.5
MEGHRWLKISLHMCTYVTTNAQETPSGTTSIPRKHRVPPSTPAAMSGAAASRLMREQRDVQQQTVPTIFAQPEEADIRHWCAASGAGSLATALSSAQAGLCPGTGGRVQGACSALHRWSAPTGPCCAGGQPAACAAAADDSLRRCARRARGSAGTR